MTPAGPILEAAGEPMTPSTEARHLLAAARGVVPGGGCSCAVCGTSPYAPGRPASDVMGDTFSDHAALAAPSEPMVCAGCVSILSGRPGDDPPPLRTLHCLAVEGEPARYPGTVDLAAILRDPPAGRFALVVAASRQRHAALRAEVSTAEQLRIGTDAETVTYRPAAHGPVLAAVETLLGGFGRDDVRTGGYAPHAVSRFGPGRWAELEQLVAELRPSPLLDLLCYVARRPETGPPPTQEIDVINDMDDALAAELVSYLAERSPHRTRDGIGFWRSFLPHRLALVAQMPLREAVSRLAGKLGITGGPDLADAVACLDRLTALEVAGVERALRSRAVLVLTYAHQTMRGRIDSRRASLSTTDTP